MDAKKPILFDHNVAVSFIEESIKTLDQTPLRPHIDGMMTEGYKRALSIATITGDAPNDFVMFLAMCEKYSFISNDEANDYSNAMIKALRAAGQMPEYVEENTGVTDDPYCYPNTTVLINFMGTKDQAELDWFAHRKTINAAENL